MSARGKGRRSLSERPLRGSRRGPDPEEAPSAPGHLSGTRPALRPAAVAARLPAGRCGGHLRPHHKRFPAINGEESPSDRELAKGEPSGQLSGVMSHCKRPLCKLTFPTKAPARGKRAKFSGGALSFGFNLGRVRVGDGSADLPCCSKGSVGRRQWKMRPAGQAPRAVAAGALQMICWA